MNVNSKVMLVLVGVCLGVSAGARAAHYDGPILLENITVVDGLGHDRHPHRDVLIHDGLIQKISATGLIGDLPDGTRIVDGKGLTVMPGLIDMHVHLPGVRQRPGTSADALQRGLDALLFAGVTTVHDMDNDLDGITKLRDDVASGDVLGPNISTVGRQISRLENVRQGVGDLNRPEAKQEIQQRFDELQEHGVTITKLYAGLSNWSARHVMTEAKARGMQGVADFWCTNLSLTGFQVTLVDGWAHGGCWEMQPYVAQWMQDNDKFAVLTLVLFDSMGGHGVHDDYDTKGLFKNDLVVGPMGKGFVQDYYKTFLEQREWFADGEHSLYANQEFPDLTSLLPVNKVNARILHEADVLVGLGTDAPFARGVFLGYSMHQEMQFHVDAGIPPLDVIKMATYNGARIIGWENKLGSVVSGNVADLLIVKGKPWEDIAATRNVAYVIKGGKLLDRDSLRR